MTPERLIEAWRSLGAEPAHPAGMQRVRLDTETAADVFACIFWPSGRPGLLIEGDGVSQDEVIAVGSDALSELVFKDETKLALGPGSQVKLDKFVYDPDKTSGSIAVNLLKGTFRFMRLRPLRARLR